MIGHKGRFLVSLRVIGAIAGGDRTALESPSADSRFCCRDYRSERGHIICASLAFGRRKTDWIDGCKLAAEGEK
jgi:hypothetical protein